MLCSIPAKNLATVRCNSIKLCIELFDIARILSYYELKTSVFLPQL